MLEIYSEVLRKARKEHTCHICGKMIEKGERYHHETGKWDGDFFNRNTCKVCALIRNDYLAETCTDEYDVYSVQDHAAEIGCSGCKIKETCSESPMNCQIVLNAFIKREIEG